MNEERFRMQQEILKRQKRLNEEFSWQTSNSGIYGRKNYKLEKKEQKHKNKVELDSDNE